MYVKDSFEAFEKLRELRWSEGEKVEVYLARRKRVASLCEIHFDEFVLHIFITGLPKQTATQIRTKIRLNKISESELVEKTKIVLEGKQKSDIAVPIQSTLTQWSASVAKMF